MQERMRRKSWWERRQDRRDAIVEREEPRPVASMLRYVTGHADASKVVQAALEIAGARQAALKAEPELVDRVREQRRMDAPDIYFQAVEALAVAARRLVEVETVLRDEWHDMIEDQRGGDMETGIDDICYSPSYVDAVNRLKGYQPKQVNGKLGSPPDVGSSVMKGA